VKYFIDTNIIIDFLEKKVEAKEQLKNLALEEGSKLFINRLVVLESLRTIHFKQSNLSNSISNSFWKNPSAIFKIKNIIDKTTLELEKTPNELNKKYYLTYSAYAIRYNNNKLEFLYDFAPWDNQDENSAKIYTLIDNPSKFEFWINSEHTLLNIKLCLKSDKTILEDEYCKKTTININSK